MDEDQAVEEGKCITPGIENYTWDSKPPVEFDASGKPIGALPGLYNPFA